MPHDYFQQQLDMIFSINHSIASKNFLPLMPDGVAVDKNTAPPSFTGMKYGLNGTLDGLLNLEACKCQK